MRRSRRSSESKKEASPTKKKGKKARFNNNTDQVHSFKKAEKVADIDRIFEGEAKTVGAVAPPPRIMKKVASVFEEEVKWDADEDYSTAYDLGGFGNAKVKVTRDTVELSVAELREELKARDLAAGGTREKMIARLEKALLKGQGDKRKSSEASPSAPSSAISAKKSKKAAAKKTKKEDSLEVEVEGFDEEEAVKTPVKPVKVKEGTAKPKLGQRVTKAAAPMKSPMAKSPAKAQEAIHKKANTNSPKKNGTPKRGASPNVATSPKSSVSSPKSRTSPVKKIVKVKAQKSSVAKARAKK